MRAATQHGLGTSLRAKFERTGSADELDAAITHLGDAVSATPPDHVDRARRLSSVGLARYRRYEVAGRAYDRERAIDAYASAAQLQTVPPFDRIHAARAAGELLAGSDLARAATLLTMAVELIPAVAPRRLERADQQRGLAELAGLAADAAALTLVNPLLPVQQRPARALQVLEAGRAVLLGQLLSSAPS